MDKRKRLWRDVFLILLLLALTAGLYYSFGTPKGEGSWAVVRINGQEAARYPLNEDGVFELNGGTNILAIQAC